MIINILLVITFIFLCILITFWVVNKEGKKEMRELTPYEEQQYELMKDTITQWSNLSYAISTKQNK